MSDVHEYVGNTIKTQAMPAHEDVSTVHKQLNRLHGIALDIEEGIQTLQQRLSDIARPLPAGPTTSDLPETQSDSKVASSISAANDRLAIAVAQINILIGSIDL